MLIVIGVESVDGGWVCLESGFGCGVGRGDVMGSVVVCEPIEGIEGAEEACRGSRAGRVVAGVNVCGGADGLVSKVEGMLMVIVIEMLEEGGFGSGSVGSVSTERVCTSGDGA